MFGDYATSLIRTVTPMIAGWLVARAVRQGWQVDPQVT